MKMTDASRHRRSCNRVPAAGLDVRPCAGSWADDARGVACLGGECFGAAGRGFLRFSCAEPDERLKQALGFLAQAFTRTERVAKYLAENPGYRLAEPYAA